MEALPGRTYAIGFVRSYADYLGLDTVVCVERFKREIAGRDEVPQPAVFKEEHNERQLPHGWLIIAVVVGLTAAGLIGLVFAPVWSLSTFSIVLGLGQGGAFGVALLLFALRAGDPQAAAQLSALAQTVGYVVGGLIGPFAVGLIFHWAGSWQVVAIFYLAVGLASLVVGLGAGRARTVKVEGGVAGN